MTLGIIVLNYNDYATTIEYVNLIKNYKNIDHIVVVDNCSTDDSYERLSNENDGTWDLIKSEGNFGYAYGNNFGVKYISDKYAVEIIGISNPDIKFDEKFIDQIKNGFENNQDYSILTGVQYGKEGDVFYHAFWETHDLKFVYAVILGRLAFASKLLKILQKKKNSANVENYCASKIVNSDNKILKVGVVCGALFFMRLKDFIEIGMFDEGTFLYFEEDIIAEKLKKIDKKTGVITDASFIHYGSETVKKNIPSFKQRKIHMKSQLYYAKKYLSKSRLTNLLLNTGTRLVILEDYIFEKTHTRR